MKRTQIFLIVLLALSLLGNAQLQVIDTATNSSASWHYTFQVPPTGSVFISFEVKNTGSTLVQSRIHKPPVQTTGSHQTYFSYGSIMYAPSTLYSIKEPLASGQSLPDINGRVGLETGFDANGSIGTTIVRYTVYDSLNHADSVNLTITYNVTSTAIAQQSTKEELRTWPNPANEEVNIQFANKTVLCVLALFNLEGQLIPVSITNETSSSWNVNVSTLPTGTYYSCILSEGIPVTTRKLIVQH